MGDDKLKRQETVPSGPPKPTGGPIRWPDTREGWLQHGIARCAFQAVGLSSGSVLLAELIREEYSLVAQLAELYRVRVPPPWPLSVGGAIGDDRKRLLTGGVGYDDARAGGVEFHDYSKASK
jgi:hypothetical protein